MIWRLALLLGLSLLSLRVAAIDVQYESISNRGGVVDIRHAGDGSGRVFLLEQTGRIWIWVDGDELNRPFLDIRDRVRSGGERGLLSLAFPPDYDRSGVFYTWYTNDDGDTVLSRFQVGTNPNQALADSEEILLMVAQPFPNHNGGQLQFGPDGYLYLGIGDGGGSGDPQNNGQNPDTLLGKIIRIDVDPDQPGYAIPSDNPFVGGDVRDEIWALGIRNPWRMAFDPMTGDLYIADVGQNSYEEINFQGAQEGGGQNYGWKRMEGNECFRSGCDTEGLVLPVGGYGHDEGCSVTGGVVFRSRTDSALYGRYLFGDFCTGTLWSLQRQGADWNQEVIDASGFAILTFGSGEDGAVYVSARGEGVFRLTDADTTSGPAFSVNAGLNDAWFDPDTAGQGFFINVFPDRELLFLSWFTYDSERPGGDAPAVLGEAGHRWFTAIGPVDGRGASLEVTLTEGGVFDSPTPVPDARPAGVMRVEFRDCSAGTITYQLDGLATPGSIPIERVVQDNVALCEALAEESSPTR